MKNGNGLHWGGIPTEPDIKKLMEAYPVESLEIGRIIPYDDTEEVIREKYGSSRWRTVTSAWRKRVLQDHAIVIGVIEELKGESFVVMDDSQKLGLVKRKHRTAVRTVRDAEVVRHNIDRKALSEAEQKEYDHRGAISAAVKAALQIKQPKQLPAM